MNVSRSYEIARRILRKSKGSRDPEEICRCLGIEIEVYELNKIKGMYSSKSNHRTIFLHIRLEGYLKRIVLAHEIAHDQIPEHRLRAKSNYYADLDLFKNVDTSEREANSVASHILIDDDQMIELVKEGKSAECIACELCIPVDLLLIALEDYGIMHPDFKISLPREPRANFLKDYTDGTF